MQLSAQEVLALKVRIKEEMLRRSGYGSLAEFGRSDYDFEHVPEEGSTVFKEHGEKTNNLALQVSDIVGVKYVSGDGEPISGMNTELESFVTQIENEAMNAEASSCRGACSGLCVGTCVSECAG